MAIQLYFESEISEEWRTGCEAASERAFEMAHPRSRRERATGTAQPEWMMRDVGFRTLVSSISPVMRNGVPNAAEGGGRWGI